MPFNPGGIFSLVASYFANPGTTIRTEQHNPPLEDIGAALSQVLIRDGRAPMIGSLNMNGFAINNVATGNTPNSVATLAQAMPIGSVIDYALRTSPVGWVSCYGQVLFSNTPYSILRTLLINDGFPYGQDGSGNPRLPDARGCVTAGFDAMSGTPAGRLTGAFGAVIGGETQTLNGTQIPPHIHPNVLSELPHKHGYGPQSISGVVQQGVGAGGVWIGSASTPIDTSTVATGISISNEANVGGGQPHPNVQPTIIMNKIIKVSYDG